MIQPISITITIGDRQQAYHFAQQQATLAKSQQVYRNTLAVLVTQHFLQLLGVETDLTASHCWHPLARQLENIADLYVPGLQGFLECRNLHKSDSKCHVPKEVQSGRIGYMIVELDEPYREGEILGFLPSVSVSELPRTYLQPLEVFLELLTMTPTPKVKLSHWLKHSFEADWQAPKQLLNQIRDITNPFHQAQPQRSRDSISQRVEQLYQPQSPHRRQSFHYQSPQEALVSLIYTTDNDEIRWQCAELLWELEPKHPACPVISAKDLGIYLRGYSVVLMIGILPKLDGKMLILLRVCPLQKQSPLPEGLRLMGLDDSGNQFFALECRQQDDYIQFKFTADVGDRFTVKVLLDDAVFTEEFMV